MGRIWGFLFLSLSLHIFSGTVATVVVPHFAPLPKSKDTTVELIEAEPKKLTQDERESKNFVGQLRVPERLKVKKQVAPEFLSDEKIAVLEQTRAANTGLNDNRIESGRSNKGAELRLGKESSRSGQKGAGKEFGVASIKRFDHGEFAVADEQRSGDETKPLALPTLGGETLEHGQSSFAYAAPHIKIGKITALNTDRFVYFGFYARTDERIYPHWENFVKAAIYTYQNTRRTFGRKEFNARYEILLKADGTYEKAILRESSGYSGVDLALAQAFRKANNFPHPPAEMVKEDGFIHLHYTVTVELGPGQIADAE